jgi:processive 1,2-diacylglycerol beta-glucosyltransferase
MCGRVLILSSRVGSGHLAAAAALEQAFRRAPCVEVCNLDATAHSTWLHDVTYSGLYFPMARVAPWLMEGGYLSTNTPFSTEPLLPLWDRLHARRLIGLIRAFRPDHVVCTHFMPAGLAGHLIASGHLRASLSVVTTDYDLHGIWLTPTFSRYFVALEETRAHWCALGLPPERAHATGIPVDTRFEAPFDRDAALAAHGLRPDPPVILVSAGASGNTSAHRVVEQLMRLRRDLQVVVVCGHNAAMRRQISAAVAADADRFRVLGHTGQMPDLMRLAALLIGKPGGLTAAECMAAGLPMLIIEPLPGQEVRNCEHLLEEGAAMRCNELTTVAWKVERLLDEPGLLASMRQRAARLGRPDAARAIAEVVLAEDLRPVRLGREERRRIVAAARGRR